MDREQATKLLIEYRLPLITVEIQDCLANIRANRGGPPANSLDILDLWKLHPWHFANYIWERTNYKLPSEVIYTSNDGNDFTANEALYIKKLIVGYYRYKSYLNRLSPEKFIELYRPLMQRRSLITREKALAFDLTQFYSFPEAEADMTHWRRYPTWELEDFVALAFGKDPRIVNGETIAGAVQDRRSIFAEEYFALRIIVLRAHDSGQLKGPLTAAAYAKWVAQANISLPESEMPAILYATTRDNDGEEKVHEGNKTIAQAIHKIILGMAIAKYQFSSDPHDTDSHSKNYGAVLNDLRAVGLPVDPTTLAKYFTRAYEFARERNLFKAAHGKKSKPRNS